MEKSIKELILSCGADVCGIAAVSSLAAPEGFSPADLYPDCRSVVVFGRALPKGLTKVASRLIYGHYNYFCCSEVDSIAMRGAQRMEERFGGFAVPIPSDGPYEYWDKENLTGRGLISMKHMAVAAGLGQLGKNTLLISPQYGNLLVIGAILTDLALAADPPCEKLCIEGCTRCIDACPVHAIQNGSVMQKLCRTNAYGQTAKGYDTVDCNRCRVVCLMRYGKIKK